ncbi:MAG: grasp-with-spasm system SPASM domain peptide maturase [Daejeonella sp.]
MVNTNDYFKLYSCCVPVKGFKRSIISDLQRNDVFFIPNELYEILQVANQKSITDIYELTVSVEERVVIKEFFDFLLGNDLGFFCDKGEHESFPLLDLKWESPMLITNAIIDINKKNISILFDCDLNAQLEELGCIALQIRAFEQLQINDIIFLLNLFKDSRLRHIDLVIADDPSLKNYYNNFFELNGRLHYLTIHSSTEENIVQNERGNAIIYTKKKISSCLSCGNINPNDFYINTQLFTESINFNSCLNRKISIDEEGYIKNCPSMKESFGNITSITLREALNEPTFKKMWNIKKDNISVCNDCEFRHICVDCRAYIEDPENINSKPLKCGYNPYTNEWKDWKTDPNKQKAINFYQMNQQH